MISLILEGKFALVGLLAITLLITFTIRQYFYTRVVVALGDRTPANYGMVNFNPLTYLSPVGIIMICIIGVTFFKPIPTDSRNFKHKNAALIAPLSGPFINFVAAFIAYNVFMSGQLNNVPFFFTPAAIYFFEFFTAINLIIMLFMLLPIGSLDGAKILAEVLNPRASYKFQKLNDQYGSYLLLVLIVLSLMGVPIFSFVWNTAFNIMPYLVIN